MTTANRTREQVWARLREVAYPDSRFHFNFAEFIPDFIDSDRALARLLEMPAYREAEMVFITPDNCLEGLREQALLDEKTVIVSTYGICRGFVLLTRDMVPTGEEQFASWLDGLEHYGRHITLREIADLGRFDLLVTGASAVSTQGIRFGKGHGFFDLEWGMFYDTDTVDQETPVVAFVDDVQVVERQLEPSATDTIVDYIVTPSRVLEIPRTLSRPSGIFWDLLEPNMLDDIPPLRELRQIQKGGEMAR